jgi:hypothetical protein
MRAPILTFKRARALRHKMTLPEVLLWQELRGGKLDGLQIPPPASDRSLYPGFLLSGAAACYRD